jgi:hypothetical protein
MPRGPPLDRDGAGHGGVMIDRRRAEILRSCLLAEPAATSAVRAAVGQAREELGPDGLVGLSDLAERHGVAGYLHARAGDLEDLPAAERERLAVVRRWIARWHLRSVLDLRFLTEVLDTAAIPWLVVKGPTLAGPGHGAPDLRSYGDLDVVVPPVRLGDAMAALEASGATVEDRNWTLILERLKGEVHLRLPSGTALDLHWHLLNEVANRRLFPIDIEGLFERRRKVLVNGYPVPTTSQSETIVYVALHTMLSGADRLIWLKDLERLVTGCDPRDVAGRAAAWRAELPLATALARVDATLGLPDAGHALRARLPRTPWTWLDGVARQLSPCERQDGSGTWSRLVARATADTSWRSWSRYAISSAKWLQEGGARAVDRQAVVDPSDPGSDRYNAGGDHARQEFLRAVAAVR